MEEALKEGQAYQENSEEKINEAIQTKIDLYNAKCEKLAEFEVIKGPNGLVINVKLAKRMKKEDLKAVQELL